AGGMPAPCANAFQGSFTIQNAADVMTISPYCEITGDLILNGAGLTTVSLPALKKIDGKLDAPNVPDLVSVSLPVLTSAAAVYIGDIEAPGGKPAISLSNVALPALATVTGLVRFYGGPISSIDLGALQSCSSFDVNNTNFLVSAAVSLPKLTA